MKNNFKSFISESPITPEQWAEYEERYNIRGVYAVGGAVRDYLINPDSNPKDIDIAVEASSFADMKEFVIALGGKIFLEKEEYCTIRAIFPNPIAKSNPAVDFVLCRKDGYYSDGRRPDSVEIGTIYDDLARRDFTMNAIAINLKDGSILDPHNGVSDIKAKTIRTARWTYHVFAEDALRVIRALRFMVQLRFDVSDSILAILGSYEENNDLPALIQKISTERKRDELAKMFKCDSIRALIILRILPAHMLEAILGGQIWFIPTMEQR